MFVINIDFDDELKLFLKLLGVLFRFSGGEVVVGVV